MVLIVFATGSKRIPDKIITPVNFVEFTPLQNPDVTNAKRRINEMGFDLFLFNKDQYIVAENIEEAVKAYINNFPKANKLAVQSTITSIEKIPIIHSVIIKKGE